MDSQGEERHLEGETPGQSWSHAPCTMLCTQPPAFSNCTCVISFPDYLVSARFCGKREQWIELCVGWNLLEACPRLHPKILNPCLKILPRVSGQLELLLINNQLSSFDFNSTITSTSSCQPVGEVIVPKNISQSRTVIQIYDMMGFHINLDIEHNGEEGFATLTYSQCSWICTCSPIYYRKLFDSR